MTTKPQKCVVVKENKRGAFKSGKPFVELWLDEYESQYPNELIVTFSGDKIPTVNIGDKVEITCSVDGRNYNDRRYIGLRGISCKVLEMQPTEDDIGTTYEPPESNDDPMPF